jgi:hypothetical protein
MQCHEEEKITKYKQNKTRNEQTIGIIPCKKWGKEVIKVFVSDRLYVSLYLKGMNIL